MLVPVGVPWQGIFLIGYQTLGLVPCPPWDRVPLRPGIFLIGCQTLGLVPCPPWDREPLQPWGVLGGSRGFILVLCGGCLGDVALGWTVCSLDCILDCTLHLVPVDGLCSVGGCHGC